MLLFFVVFLKGTLENGLGCFQHPIVLGHLIDIENDIYHPTKDSNIDDEDFTSLDEHTSMTGSYLHHDDYASVMSTTMIMSPTQDLILLPLIIPIIFLHNI